MILKPQEVSPYPYMRNTYILCIMLLFSQWQSLHAIPREDKAREYFEEGQLLHKEGKLGAAIAKFEAAIHEDNQFAAAYFELAQLYFEREQFDMALAYGKVAGRMNCKPATAFLGNCYEAMQQAELALQQYTLALQREPSDAHIAFRLASLYAKQQEFAFSIPYYLTALADSSLRAEACYQLAKMYFLMSNYQGAAPAFIQAANWGRMKDADYFYHLGLTQINQNNFKEGIANLESAQVLRTNDIRVMQVLADAYFKQGMFSKAVHQWKNILILQPQNAFAMFMLGKSLMGNGEVEKGQLICDQALNLGDAR